ncbi:MAG: class I SAM-dependent methyltransferase [Kofleriaceae bacterium]
MIKAIAKGAVQLGFGRLPGGPGLYRALTRGDRGLGTAASHADKLARVWPGYVATWRRFGIELEGRALWTHDAGATPFMPFAAFLLTGRGAVVTGHEPMLARYLDRARSRVLDATWPDGAVPDARRRVVEGLRWRPAIGDALAAVDAQVCVTSSAIADRSIELCHSGGALEHERPHDLHAWLAEQVRVLRPGGVSSHVYDHRDHLHHTDNALPFLSHLAWPEPVYRVAIGHRLGYHARLSPTEVTAAFVASGLEPIAVRRLIYDGRTRERRWVDDDEAALAGSAGIERARLARQFRAWSDVDLRTAAGHYLFRRPP